MADTEYEAEGTIPDPWSLPLETFDVSKAEIFLNNKQGSISGDCARKRQSIIARKALSARIGPSRSIMTSSRSIRITRRFRLNPAS